MLRRAVFLSSVIALAVAVGTWPGLPVAEEDVSTAVRGESALADESASWPADMMIAMNDATVAVSSDAAPSPLARQPIVSEWDVAPEFTLFPRDRAEFWGEEQAP